MSFWSKLYLQFKHDVRLWVYCVIVQQICRAYYLINLHAYLSPNTNYIDLLTAMLHSIRFDSLWATVVILISLIFRRRKTIAFIFTLTTIIIFIISIEYYKEYHDVFNQFLFGLIYDDTLAIIKTIYASGYLIKYSLTIFASVILFSYIIYPSIVPQKSFTNYQAINKPNIIKIILVTAGIIIFYIAGYRGGLGARPIQAKDAGVTNDLFLNKIIISPYSSLKYALKEHFAINAINSRFKSLNKDLVLAKARQRFGANYLLNHARALHANKIQYIPKHIFIIVGESYDAWALQDEYQDLNLTNQVKSIANKGVSLRAFLPASTGTMTSLNTIISGLPDTGLMTNYQLNSTMLYPTAPAGHFKRLGYQTNFFYGGYLSWQRVAEFAKNQGFNFIYGASHIASWTTTTEWGVDDKSLFAFITQTINNNVPSYNLIMTTSNHPPFAINLAQEGLDVSALEEVLLKKFPNSPTNAKKLGHLWYTDQMIGKFINTIEAKLDKTLFVITGDHYGRRHVLPNPPLFDSSAVPFILYGKGITDNLKLSAKMAGSHLDLGATLLELVAPKGFSYYTLGKNLLAEPSTEEVYGVGRNLLITKDQIINVSQEQCSATIDHKLYCDYYSVLIDIAWWYIAKGNLI